MAERGVIGLRDARAEDRARWRQLWAGYLAFYATELADAMTDYTWRRILDPAAPLLGRVAELDGELVGFSHTVIHEGTWCPTPIGYLEDLFVDPAVRGRGLGRALVQDLVDLGRSRGWSRLYWHTRADNPARHLYDQFVLADGFVHYQLSLRHGDEANPPT